MRTIIPFSAATKRNRVQELDAASCSEWRVRARSVVSHDFLEHAATGCSSVAGTLPGISHHRSKSYQRRRDSSKAHTAGVLHQRAELRNGQSIGMRRSRARSIAFWIAPPGHPHDEVGNRQRGRRDQTRDISARARRFQHMVECIAAGHEPAIPSANGSA